MWDVYLDNASSSWPKLPGTIDAMNLYLRDYGCNTGRGVYQKSMEVSGVIYETREALTHFFGGENSSGLIFTNGVTQSLNLVLLGLLKRGDHVLLGGIAHNAISRPLAFLKQKNVNIETIPFSLEYGIDISQMKKRIRKETKAVVITHGCNVSGYIQPLAEIGEICRENGLVFIVDAAQTAGFFPIHVNELCIDALCFSGHKGLGGPPGIGGVLMSERLAREVEPLMYGGTGGYADAAAMPHFLPERLEAGTMNIPGIYALREAVRYLTLDRMKEEEKQVKELTEYLQDELQHIQGIRLVSCSDADRRGHVLSFQPKENSMADMAMELDRNYGIMIRSGLHCAMSSHRVLGTLPEGTIRISPGRRTKIEEIDYVIQAIWEIVNGKTRNKSHRII